MTRRNNERKANGHAGPHNRVNGHALASTERGGVPVQRGQAASDDARGTSVASAAASPAAAGLQPQASTDREACAEVAPPPPNGEAIGSAQEESRKRKTPGKIPPGESPLPQNPGDFVEEIHRRADLFVVWKKLLNSKDPKIKQRAAEKLTEMRYKGPAALADEPQQIVIDIDSAVARRAAEGARK